MAYISGKVRAICDRCGFEYPRSKLKREWTGLLVCEQDFDIKPYELDPPKVRPEGVPIKDARPDNQTDTTPNTTTGDDL